MTSAARQVLLLSRREVRRGKLAFVLPVLTNLLAAAMLTAVLGLGDSLRTTLARDARSILGGDFEVRLNARSFEPDEIAWLRENSDRQTEITLIRAAAFTEDLSALVQVRAVDDNYPLVGSIELADDIPYSYELLTTPVGDRISGLISEDLANSLGLGIGDVFHLGAAKVEVAGLVTRIPDPSATMMLNAPVVYISFMSLGETGFAGVGTLRTEAIRVDIGARDRLEWREAIDAAYPEDDWRIRGTDRVVPNLQELIGRMETLLLLVSLGTMLIAGICVGNSVSIYLRSRIVSIAVLRSLGMPSSRIRAAYWLVAMLFVLAGALLGQIPGQIAQTQIINFLSGQLPFTIEAVSTWGTSLTVVLIAVLVAWIFAMRPLHKYCSVSPTQLFSLSSSNQATVLDGTEQSGAASVILPAALLVALLMTISSDQLFLLYFCAGGAAATMGFRMLATGFVSLLGRMRPSTARRKIALRSVVRSSDQLIGASVSLGIGLTALLTFSLTEASFNGQLQKSLESKAPDYYLIGLQEGDPEALREATAEWQSGPDSFRTLPMQRIEITHIKGVPEDEMEISEESDWIIRGRTTWVDDQTTEWFGTARVSEGEPWTPENGRMLVSVDEEAGKGLGLALGDELIIRMSGESYTVEVANFRRIDWSTFDVNFGLVLSDGPWAEQPHGYLASARDLRGDDFAFQRRVVEVAPSVTPIRTKTIVASVTGMLVKISVLLQLVTITAMVSGIMVLAAAIGEGRHRRAHESIVLRIIGVSRAMLAAVFRAEFIYIASLAAVPSLLIASIASYSVTVYLLNLPWTLDWNTAFIVLFGTLAIVLAIGSLSTRQLVRNPPLQLLHNN